MLVWMKLKNLALVAEAEIEFSPGYNVISGETGAGKSVIMGGVSLLLGARADKSLIRAGTDRCEISAEFQVPEYARPRIAEILEQAGLEAEEGAESILIRRVVTASSTRNFINSEPVALPVLRALGELLVDIHAANENQSLAKPQEQLRTLDRFAGLAPLLERTAAAWSELCACRSARAKFLAGMPSDAEAAEYRKDAEFIRKANPEPGEDEALAKRHLLAANSRSVIEIASKVSAGLTEGEDSLFDRAAEIRRALNELEKYDPEGAAEYIPRMEAVADAVSELSSDLADYASDIELDEGAFQAMEERMRLLQTLKRRYGPALEDVLARLAELDEKLRVFDNAEIMRGEWEKRLASKEAGFASCCAELSEARRAAAGKLARLLTEETVKLGFAQARFELEFSGAEPGPGGADRLQILFSANPGVPLKPLKDVASSGEIARVMLAAKTVLAEADEIPVLVFDEIDANIGGETASHVGEEIASLGRRKQVICISHLPQTVRLADRHFLVSKSTDGIVTRSCIRELDGEGRLKELSRMLGGGKAAETHARALLTKK